MQYAPPISSNIGNILATAGANSSKTYMEGMEALGDGIKAAGSIIAGGMTKAGETRIASDGVNAKFDMLKGIKKSDGSNLISQDIIDKFDTMPLGKRQGIVSTADSLMDYDLKQWMYGVQYNAQNNRLTQAQLQNQVPANQVPMGTNAAPAAQPAPAPYTFNPQIQTRPAN
jgi:hypothetical protein